ncbi:MAG: CRISPR system precrRNA processing endoribonuclease RAMP protein Cas6 [Methylococcaceae bacterium]
MQEHTIMPFKLPFAEFRLHFETEGFPRLPRYAGSTWRGALGHALKRTVCVVRDTPCSRCMLNQSCAYTYLFETPPAPDSAKMSLYTAAPHPFVLVMDPTLNAVKPEYSLGLILFGKAQPYLPHLIHALGKAGAAGLGRSRQKFDLAGVEQKVFDESGDTWQLIYEPGQPLQPPRVSSPLLPVCPDTLRIELLTPLRIRRMEQYVTPLDFRFSDFFSPLLRRISMLTFFHTDTPLETDFAGLTQLAKTVDVLEPELSWRDWTRYSTRQDSEMQMGGLLGCFSLSGESVARFWPYLWQGQWTHTGKAATMGLGRYRIVGGGCSNG